jgi:ankyrin repeat protein
LPKLRQAGDDIEGNMMFQGLTYATPLFIASFFNDTAATRAAIDGGAKVDAADDDGITALGWAAMGNMTGVAKVLIEHGADVNHVDKLGMTPLLYAASVDFGDSSMVDLLLKSGANAVARTREGLTAANLARKYGLRNLLKSLGP